MKQLFSICYYLTNSTNLETISNLRYFILYQVAVDYPPPQTIYSFSNRVASI